MGKTISFNQLVMLLLLAAGLFFLVQYTIDESRENRAQKYGILPEHEKLDTASFEACLKSGKSGSDCAGLL